jgi:hypothetical protein
MATDLIAFIDESKKPMRDRRTGRVARTGDHYVVAGGVVISGDADRVRLQIAGLEADLGFPMHYSDMSPERRRRAAQALATVDGWEGHLFETARALPNQNYNEHFVRAKVIGAALEGLSTDGGVDHATLETRNHPGRGLNELDEKDHQVLQKLLSQQRVPSEFRITHADKSEKLLAIADLLAGARTDYLCAVDTEPFVLLGHLIQRPVKVFGK